MGIIRLCWLALLVKNKQLALQLLNDAMVLMSILAMLRVLIADAYYKP
jgi:hypothetical protein